MCVPVRVCACMYVCICAYVLEMNVRKQVSGRAAPTYFVGTLAKNIIFHPSRGRRGIIYPFALVENSYSNNAVVRAGPIIRLALANLGGSWSARAGAPGLRHPAGAPARAIAPRRARAVARAELLRCS